MSLPDESPTAYSPSDSADLSEVPTVPLNPAETRLIQDYMTRRQHFLSDYERYNPVQNMHALANHVFDLTEGIYAMKDQLGDVRGTVKEEIAPVAQESARQGRILDFVSTQQKELGEGLGGLGRDVSGLGHEVGGLSDRIGAVEGGLENLGGRMNALEGHMGGMDGRMTNMEGYMGGMGQRMNTMEGQISTLQNDVDGLKTDVNGLKTDVSQMRNDIGGLRADVEGLKSDVGQLKDNVQQGFAEIKALMMASLSSRVQAQY